MVDLASALLSGTRKKKFHELLAQQSMSTAPTPSWGAALARALQGGIAGMMENRERDSDGTEFDRLFGQQASVQPTQPAPLATALAGDGPQTQSVKTAGRPVQVIEGDGPSPLDPPSGKDRDIAIRTIYGEDPGASALGVANVMRRRAIDGNFGGNTLSQVAMAKGQFEPWARPDAKARMMALSPDSPTYQRLGQTLDQAYAGNDPTGGATHFYAPQVQASLGRQAPKWDQGPSTTIGPHKFIGGVEQPESEMPPGAQLAQGQMPPQMAQPQQTRVAPQIPPHIMGQARKLWQEGDRAAAGALMQPYLTPKDQEIPVTDPAERLRAGIPPTDKGAYQRNTGTNKISPINTQPQTTINNTVNPVLKGISDRFDKAMEAADSARSQIQSIHEGRRALDEGAITGLAADPKLFAARVASMFGLPSAAAENTQVMRSALGNQTLDKAKTLGANPTNEDRRIIQEITGGKGDLEEKSIRRIIDMQERWARESIKRANSMGQRLRDAQPDEFKNVAPLMTMDEPETYDEYIKKSPIQSKQPAPSIIKYDAQGNRVR
jgi:hypothetical protein